MPLSALARWLPFPHRPTPAKVPVDPKDVFILRLRLQEAETAGELTLDTVHLISLQHQIGMAKKAKVAAQKAKQQAILEARAATEDKKTAQHEKRLADSHEDRQRASEGFRSAVDRFERAVADRLHAGRQQQAAEAQRRALERTAGVSNPAATGDKNCLSSYEVID